MTFSAFEVILTLGFADSLTGWIGGFFFESRAVFIGRPLFGRVESGQEGAIGAWAVTRGNSPQGSRKRHQGASSFAVEGMLSQGNSGTPSLM